MVLSYAPLQLADPTASKGHNSLQYLPWDVLFDILCRLSIPDVIALRLVSRFSFCARLSAVSTTDILCCSRRAISSTLDSYTQDLSFAFRRVLLSSSMAVSLQGLYEE